MSKAIIAAALVIMAATPAVSQDASPAASQAEAVEAPDPEAAKIVADCSARKFETAVEIEKDGKKRLTKMKLCAAKDSDDAAWVKTLEDAKAKIATHPDISAESKASIASQLDVEIAKYGAVSTASVSPPAAPLVATLPPPAPTVAMAASTAAPAPKPAVAKPRLTVRCLDPGESGAGSSCSSLNRATRLQVRADADLGQGVSLRFLRRGDMRAEIALAQLKQGEIYRSKLPPELCAGVASTKVEIQIVGGKQVAETLGPFNLRC